MKVAVVVSTCDVYGDCWEPMILSLKKNWSDCPYSIFFISNFKEILDEKVVFIKVGKHLGWGANTKKALSSLLEYDYIIYLQEDYFLDKEINSVAIQKQVEYCHRNNIDYLRLGWPFRDSDQIHDTLYCKDPLEKKYSLCLQPAIWKRTSLLQLCIEGYTGWDFERKIKDFIHHSSISLKSQVIHSSSYPEAGIYLVPGTGVRKGMWTQDGASFLRKNGFEQILNGRKIEGPILSFLMKRKDKITRIPSAIIIRLLQKFTLNI